MSMLKPPFRKNMPKYLNYEHDSLKDRNVVDEYHYCLRDPDTMHFLYKLPC